MVGCGKQKGGRRKVTGKRAGHPTGGVPTAFFLCSSVLVFSCSVKLLDALSKWSLQLDFQARFSPFALPPAFAPAHSYPTCHALCGCWRFNNCSCGSTTLLDMFFLASSSSFCFQRQTQVDFSLDGSAFPLSLRRLCLFQLFFTPHSEFCHCYGVSSGRS